MGPDPENRVGDQDIGSPGQFLLGCKCLVSQGIVMQEQEPIGGPFLGSFPSKCPSLAPAKMSNTWQ